MMHNAMLHDYSACQEFLLSYTVDSDKNCEQKNFGEFLLISKL